MYKTKKILLISYHYPPSTAVGGLRIYNFSKHLSDFGWTPYVLTIKEKYIEQVNGHGKQTQQGVEIYRTGKLPRMINALLAARNRARNHGAPLKHQPDHPPAVPAGGAMRRKQQDRPERPLQKLKRYFASLFLALPDGERNWVLPAAVKALHVIRKEKIDGILTSCPPYSVHLAGLLVHTITGINWIADFRDPWFIASSKSMFPTCKLSRAIEGRLEKAVVQRAKLIVTNTEKLCKTFREAYANESPDKFVHISNGISKSIFGMLGNLTKYNTFTLIYAGSLYFYRTPEPVFKAIRELIDEDQIDEDGIQINLVGNCASIDGVTPTQELIKAYGLEHRVLVMPPVPYLEALKMVRRSHLALLFAPDQPYQIPAKVYDYIGTGTKILAIANKGATSELIDKTKSGRAFVPDDIGGIKSFILSEMNHGDPSSLNAEHYESLLERFDYRKISGRLSDHMRRMIE